MLNVSKIAEWLKDKTAWQETPETLTDNHYVGMVIDAIERLFVDTGRARNYSEDLYVTVNSNELWFDYDIPLDEKLYIQLCCQLNFFAKVQSDVNNTFGYSTDALTVTNADKPYANLRDTIEKIDNERRIIYYKMVRYTLGEA